MIFAAGDEESEMSFEQINKAHAQVPQFGLTWTDREHANDDGQLEQRRWLVAHPIVAFFIQNRVQNVNDNGIQGRNRNGQNVRHPLDLNNPDTINMLAEALFTGANAAYQTQQIQMEPIDTEADVIIWTTRVVGEPTTIATRHQTIWAYMDFPLAVQMIQFAEDHQIGTQDQRIAALGTVLRLADVLDGDQKQAIEAFLEWILETYGDEALQNLLHIEWNPIHNIKSLFEQQGITIPTPPERQVKSAATAIVPTQPLITPEVMDFARGVEVPAPHMTRAQRLCNQLGIATTSALVLALAAYYTYYSNYFNPGGSN